jgi:hypothetical protein
VALDGNLGFARAMNAAVARTTTRIALLANSDVLFKPDAIRRLVAALEADSVAALASPRLLRPDGSRQAAAVPEPRWFWEVTNRSLARRLLRVPIEAAGPVPGIVGPCMAVDLERIRPVGLLDERFFFFFEETDWCRRVRQQGLHVLLVPDAEIVHLQGKSANVRPVRARIQFYSSRYRYFRKHSGRPVVVLLFTAFLLRLLVEFLVQTMMAIVTLGLVLRWRARWRAQATILLWHLLLCRPAWGFEPARSGRMA